MASDDADKQKKMAADKADSDKRKYTKQRLDAEADFKKTGKKSATYQLLEKKGYEKTNPSPAPSTNKSAKSPTPGVDWSTSPLAKIAPAIKDANKTMSGAFKKGAANASQMPPPKAAPKKTAPDTAKVDDTPKRRSVYPG
jgi:hypothetical protein